MKQALNLILSLVYTNALLSSPVYIIIHGTWATHAEWYQKGGDFYTTVSKSLSAPKQEIRSFTWSGCNDHCARLYAAHKLYELLHEYPAGSSFVFIAHSHGANVGILTTHLLDENNVERYTIDAFYALGVPIDTACYFPAMNRIKSFYNLYSVYDFVQPVLGLYGRIFPPHPRITNVRVTVNGKNPNHSQLHDPEIGAWLILIHESLAKKKAGNFQAFSFKKNNCVDFTTGKVPIYTQNAQDMPSLQETILQSLSRIITQINYLYSAHAKAYQEYHLQNDTHPHRQNILQVQPLH